MLESIQSEEEVINIRIDRQRMEESFLLLSVRHLVKKCSLCSLEIAAGIFSSIKI